MDYQLDLQQANGFHLLDWFASGAEEVAAHKKYLNDINVFPVADGDTGTNLSTTLRAMVEKPARASSFAGMLQGISKSGIESARGNSGIIFASFVNGIALECQPAEAVDVREFSSIAYRAVKHLYEAVDHPVEGTLMSVIRDWASFLENNKDRFSGFRELFSSAYQSAFSSLEKTKEQIKVLKKHNVVDSGAAGFVRFLQGINLTFSRQRSVEMKEEAQSVPVITGEEETAFRYCVEALVDISDYHERSHAALKEKIKHELSYLGDSLIVNHLDGRLKVHIHTNNPELVMERLAQYGPFIDQKADDMALQSRLRSMAQGGIGLLTDSIADIPDDYKLERAISTLPMGVMIDGSAYLDKFTMQLEQLFPRMGQKEGYPTSSQPEPGRIQALLSALTEQFDSLIVLSVSDRLSGTYQALVKAASVIAPDKKITVIDTRLNSGAQGLLVRAAAEMVAQGLPHEQVVERIKQMIPRTKIYVCLNTLAYAVRGGRVPDTIGKVGIKLGLRPIMTLDSSGNGAAFGVAFSQAGLTKKIIGLVQKTKQRKGIQAYSIVHGGNLALAKEYADKIARITGKAPAFITEISSVVALHAGPGTVAVCLVEGAV
ncbi:MAG: DegV family protein [Eubacteriales bacterium]|jgi:DegV family protein with EDD domain|nr:DegV family protein [Eubacteriales bacterium]